MVLGALTIISLSGLKNSQFAQDQTNATKLAQQGLEEVRAMRDQNQDGSVCIPNQAGSFSKYNWSELWNYSCGASCNFSVISSGYCNLVPTAAASPYLSESPPAAVEIINNKFTRKIIVEDYAASQKKVTAQVSWSDTDGNHQTDLVTVLTNK